MKTYLADAGCDLGGRCDLVLAVEFGYPLVVSPWKGIMRQDGP